MNRQISQNSSFGIFGKAVVTATLLGCSAIPYGAQAGQAPDVLTSGVTVSVISPSVSVADPNKQIEISAFYQAAPVTGGVTTLELYVDGQQIALKTLDTPEDRGVVSFVISPGTLSAGNHHVVIRVSAIDAEVASAKTGLNIGQQAADDSAINVPSVSGSGDAVAAPAVAIMAPLSDATVAGTIDIKVDAHDSSGKPPYVSLFIDHTFKTLRNFPPFDFAWDTTRVANGYHTIEVWGYNDDQAVGHAQPLTVFVNNPGGRTLVRRDLLDTVPTKTAIKPIQVVQLAAVHLHPAVKAAASLANGTPAVASKLDRLASAEVDDNLSGLSEQDQLMSPFIATHVAQSGMDTVTSVNVVSPSLAVRTVTTANAETESLSKATSQNPTLDEAVELATPTLEELTPDAVLPQIVATVQPKPAVSAAVRIKPVEIASATLPPAMVTPDVTSASQSWYSVHLESTSAAVVADDEAGPSLETPQAPLSPELVKAFAKQTQPATALAPEKAIDGSSLESTRMASSNIGASSLLSSGPMLQVPELPATRVLNLITAHQDNTHMVRLGATGAGFPVPAISKQLVVINDHTVLLSEPLQDHSKFLFAPFRQIFENEGGVMAWNATSREVHALNGKRDVEITIGSKSAVVNQEPITMNAAPYIERGHTMIPLAFVPIALDATVDYDPATGHIVINSND